jgi:hypothetical protein
LLGVYEVEIYGLDGGLGAVGDFELGDEALKVFLPVERLRCSSWAISRLVLPAGRNLSTSSSRGVNDSGRGCVRFRVGLAPLAGRPL